MFECLLLSCFGFGAEMFNCTPVSNWALCLCMLILCVGESGQSPLGVMRLRQGRGELNESSWKAYAVDQICESGIVADGVEVGMGFEELKNI